MKIEKLGPTAFIAIDLDGAPCSAGIVRSAPKILQGGAKDLARSATYTFALRGLQVGGASAGISAEPEDRDGAIAAFVDAILPRVEAGELAVDPGKGVPAEALSALVEKDPRAAVRRESIDGRPIEDHLAGLGAVVAAEAALGSLDGARAGVEPGPAAEAVTAVLAARGVSDVRDSISEEVDVAFCGSRAGVIDGETAEAISARLVVPIGPLALSAKGLAVLRRRGIVALPDFLALSGPSYAGWPAGEATVDAVLADAEAGIAGMVGEVLAHDEGPVLGACYRAESFLSTWQDTLPFGRPLA